VGRVKKKKNKQKGRGGVVVERADRFGGEKNVVRAGQRKLEKKRISGHEGKKNQSAPRRKKMRRREREKGKNREKKSHPNSKKPSRKKSLTHPATPILIQKRVSGMLWKGKGDN